MKQFLLIFIVFLFSGTVTIAKSNYSKSTVNVEINDTDDDVIIREVMPNETKADIAKEFGITVTELEMQNPAIIDELPVGFMLKIRIPEDVTLIIEDNSIKTNFNIQIAFELFVDEIIDKANKKIGVPYNNGGTSNSGFDCSGLIYAIFENFDINLPRSSTKQSEFGTIINIANAQKGDLIFFDTNGKKNRVNHVGMIVEVTADGEIKFIHSSLQNGVMISSTSEAYYRNKVIQVNRIL